MELGRERTALVVIDMQRAFLEDEGSLAQAGIDITGLKVALDPCKRLLASARQAGVPVIHTRCRVQKVVMNQRLRRDPAGSRRTVRKKS